VRGNLPGPEGVGKERASAAFARLARGIRHGRRRAPCIPFQTAAAAHAQLLRQPFAGNAAGRPPAA